LKPTNTCWPTLSGWSSTSGAVRDASIESVGAPGRCRARRDFDPQPLDRADELQLDDGPAADDGHHELVPVLGENHVLRPHDDGRFVTAAQRSRPAVHLEVRLAELHVAIAIRPEHQVGCPQERRYEARAGPLIQRTRLADLLKAAAIHHADAIRHAERFFLVVRDHDRRDADRALNLTDRAPELLANLRVECAERLVEQQHARLMRESSRERDALLLAAGQLARQPLVVAVQRDELQQLGASAAALGAANSTCAERELDVVRHRHVAEQRVVLKHEADLALLRAEARHVAPVQHDSAVIDRGKPRYRAQQRALAAA
jgi:hypothetical protein